MKDVEMLKINNMKGDAEVLNLIISNILDDLGIPRGKRSRVMLKDAIYYNIVNERFDMYPSMNEIYISIGRSFYPGEETAKIYSRVERSIRHVLGTVYNKPHTKMWNRLFCDYKPSNSEFIMTCSDMIASGEYDKYNPLIEEDVDDKSVEEDDDIDIGELKSTLNISINELKSIIRQEIRNTIHECMSDD